LASSLGIFEGGLHSLLPLNVQLLLLATGGALPLTVVLVAVSPVDAVVV